MITIFLSGREIYRFGYECKNNRMKTKGNIKNPPCFVIHEMDIKKGNIQILFQNIIFISQVTEIYGRPRVSGPYYHMTFRYRSHSSLGVNTYLHNASRKPGRNTLVSLLVNVRTLSRFCVGLVSAKPIFGSRIKCSSFFSVNL